MHLVEMVFYLRWHDIKTSCSPLMLTLADNGLHMKSCTKAGFTFAFFSDNFENGRVFIFIEIWPNNTKGTQFSAL